MMRSKKNRWFCFWLLSFCFALSAGSCGELNKRPVPKEKESFIGIWKSSSGFEIEIKAEGLADIKQIEDRADPDYDKLYIKRAGQSIKGVKVFFMGDSSLKVIEPFNYAKKYHIEKEPYQDGDTLRMILNGVMLAKHKE
ncbi:MAG TPA: hypothetical protein VI757_14930 [Bacteroidia bacterium]|nr:hypothetical protein [Bacteroidia bacterium]